MKIISRKRGSIFLVYCPKTKLYMKPVRPYVSIDETITANPNHVNFHKEIELINMNVLNFVEIRKIILLVVFFYTLLSTGQNHIIDSLTTLSRTEISDSLRVKVYGDLCWYYSAVEVDSSFHYGNLALDLSKKTNNIKGEAQAYNDFGIIYYKLSEFDKSISYYKKALVIREKLKDTLGIGSLYNKMGIAYQRIFKMDSALYYNTEALEIYQQAKNVKYAALIKNNIANIYFNLKQPRKALQEHLEVAEIRKDINDDYGLVHSYTNIGNSYLSLKDTLQSISYYKRGIDIAENNNYEPELAALYNNYGAILKDRNDFKNAIVYFEKSLELRKKIKDNYGVASVSLNLGDLYLSMNKLAESERYMRQGLFLAKKTNANELEMNSYKSLLSLFAFKKNTDSVLNYQKRYISAQDSILNTRITKEIAEIQEKYDTAQREKEIAQQKEQLLKNKLQIKNKNLISIILGFVILLLGMMAYGMYKRQKHKREEFKNKIALKEAQSYNKLQDQRLRISRDLHDNIGSQMTFIISSVENLKFLTKDMDQQFNEKFQQIIQFSKDTIAQLRDTIWAMNQNEISFENFESRILSFLEKAKLSDEKVNISFNSEISEPLFLTSIKGINLFRVVQEAINNALKHANASTINVNITKHNDNISIEISDNGKGFDIANIDAGFGLENMQKRIEY